MSRRILLLPLLFSAWLPLAAADRPLFEERFNAQDGSVDYLNGAAQGAPGSGVSGHVDDRAYTAPAEGRQIEGPRPYAIVPGVDLPGSMPEFTVTLWFKNSGRPLDPDSLLNIGGLYLVYQQNAGWTMRVDVPRGGRDFSNWFAARSPGQAVDWLAEDAWIFYAISWNYETKTAVIYQGTATEPAVMNRTFEAFDVTGPLQNASHPAIIGNHLDARTKKPGERPFSGSIDNIRIFPSALDEQTVEQIRQADTANKPFPG